MREGSAVQFPLHLPAREELPLHEPGRVQGQVHGLQQGQGRLQVRTVTYLGTKVGTHIRLHSTYGPRPINQYRERRRRPHLF